MKYMLIWDTDNCCDGYEIGDYDSEEEAKEALKECYIEWEIQEIWNWKFSESGMPMPTTEQINDWDAMYWNCSCYLVPFDEELGSYSEGEYDEIYLNDKEHEEIGWMEWNELAKKWGLETT